MLFLYKNVKYTDLLVEKCALMHVFQKRPGCALTGACALIRTNTVRMTAGKQVGHEPALIIDHGLVYRWQSFIR